MKDYRDDMTLGDIKINDTDMLEDAIKGAKKYTFDNLLQAKMFVKHCVDITYKRHGIQVNVPRIRNEFTMLRFEKELKKMFDKANVVTETRGRNHYRGNDTWKRGIYIFKDGVLSAFISNPFMHVQAKYFKDPMGMPQTKTKGYYVFTNARVDDIQRVYGPVNQKEQKLILPPSGCNAKLPKGG